MNEDRIDLPNGDFTFVDRKNWPFTVTLGLGKDGSIGVYNDEYTRVYVDRDAMIAKLRGMKCDVPEFYATSYEEAKNNERNYGYNTAIDNIIKMLEGDNG